MIRTSKLDLRRTTDAQSAKELAAPADIPAIESRLDSAFDRSNLPIAATHRRALAEYVALLAQWNRAYNLTAVRDPFAMIDRHVLDSLTALDFLAGSRLLDVGTGAGLPGLVLAIVRPDVCCTLLDPVRKKTRFCAHAAMTLGLGNVEVASERLDRHRPPHRYSTVISRATLSVAALVAGARPLLDAPGRIIAMKGPRPEAEIDALEPGDREGLEIRVEPAGAGIKAGVGPPTTLVVLDRPDGVDGVPMRENVTIRPHSTR
ncbi:MAG: 16S rRNA (guanine(527)-N(7))-methyltransferase RsmG [Thiotrichales bacterium]|nr:16S rRNA (guanine(527)-N(7))-methyltransferase RsmG [Thiotrichales bacterium]